MMGAGQGRQGRAGGAAFGAGCHLPDAQVIPGILSTLQRHLTTLLLHFLPANTAWLPSRLSAGTTPSLRATSRCGTPRRAAPGRCTPSEAG